MRHNEPELVRHEEAVDQEVRRRHPILRTVRVATGPVNNWSAAAYGKEKGGNITIRGVIDTEDNSTIS